MYGNSNRTYGLQKIVEHNESKRCIISKPDFSDEDGLLAADLEEKFAEMNGWNAESDAAMLLSGLGIAESHHNKQMKELSGNEKYV
jgi:ATPase subunit of ABC transporter with duplicated ATPase domains